jgi:Disulfide bond chaperones of the HSP33 family
MMDRETAGFDRLARFWLNTAPARGVVARLDHSLAQALAQHEYPPVVRRLLRELSAAAVLLASNLKQEATIILQAQGDGPVPLLCVEANQALQFRAYADVRAPLPPQAQDLRALIGGQGLGRLALTIEPVHGQRYQGIVALEHASVPHMLEAYLSNSQQTPTRLWLREDGEVLEAVLLERMPLPESASETGREALLASWNQAEARMAAAFAEPFMPFPYAQWLGMVFEGEELRLHPQQAVSFHCPCSYERVLGALKLVGHEELMSLAEQRGGIDTRCEFCGAIYQMSLSELQTLFQAEAVDGRHPPVTRSLQ